MLYHQDDEGIPHRVRRGGHYDRRIAAGGGGDFVVLERVRVKSRAAEEGRVVTVGTIRREDRASTVRA